MTEVRCDFKMHAQIVEGELEVKCSSKWCGAGVGVVVLHRFDLESGRLLTTNRYKDPGKGE